MSTCRNVVVFLHYCKCNVNVIKNYNTVFVFYRFQQTLSCIITLTHSK